MQSILLMHPVVKYFTMRSISLSIPTPCHENWNNMQPTEKGRFCNACAKQVVDFSAMSDREVLNYLNNLKGQQICGRATPGQLSRVMEQLGPAKKMHWFWQYAALFLLFFSGSREANAQKKVVSVTVQPPSDKDRIVGEIAIQRPKRAISGRVTDESGNPVPFVSVTVVGGGRRYTAGKEGTFSFLVDDTERQLSIAARGFNTTVIVLTDQTNYNIKVERSVPQMIMGKMIARPKN